LFELGGSALLHARWGRGDLRYGGGIRALTTTPAYPGGCPVAKDRE
jgi:hypothetical protein